MASKDCDAATRARNARVNGPSARRPDRPAVPFRCSCDHRAPTVIAADSSSNGAAASSTNRAHLWRAYGAASKAADQASWFIQREVATHRRRRGDGVPRCLHRGSRRRSRSRRRPSQPRPVRGHRAPRNRSAQPRHRGTSAESPTCATAAHPARQKYGILSRDQQGRARRQVVSVGLPRAVLSGWRRGRRGCIARNARRLLSYPKRQSLRLRRRRSQSRERDFQSASRRRRVPHRRPTTRPSIACPTPTNTSSSTPPRGSTTSTSSAISTRAASPATRFKVELSFLQRFRSIADGATFEEVFTGYSDAPDPSRQTTTDPVPIDTNPFRASGTLGIALRRYQEGPWVRANTRGAEPHRFRLLLPQRSAPRPQRGHRRSELDQVERLPRDEAHQMGHLRSGHRRAAALSPIRHHRRAQGRHRELERSVRIQGVRSDHRQHRSILRRR